jgi:ABC-2 type transport system permease protein
MRGLTKLAWVEFKLFTREFFATFFTLAFPVMMLLFFGMIYGNEKTDFFGGYGMIDIAVPSYTAMIIATSGIISITTIIASYRERGILRRLHATPLRPHTILSAHVFVIFIMTVLGMTLLIIMGKLVYGLQFEGNLLSVAAAFTLSSISFFSLGFLLAGLIPTARTAQAVAMVIFYPMIFLSGAAIPLEVLPENIKTVATFLPLKHVVTLLRGLWIGQGWDQHLTEVGVLILMLIICVTLSTRSFRWE